MARVTIEDCTQKIPSRFELVVLAAQRAKEIGSGAKPTVERDNDKNSVVALREIAEGTIAPDSLRESVIRKHQKRQAVIDQDVPEDEEMNMTREISTEMKSLEVADKDDMSDMFSDEIDESEEESE